MLARTWIARPVGRNYSDGIRGYRRQLYRPRHSHGGNIQSQRFRWFELRGEH